MKKITAAILAIVIMLSLCACAGGASGSETDASQASPAIKDIQNLPESTIGSPGDESRYDKSESAGEDNNAPSEQADEYFTKRDHKTESDKAVFVDLSKPNEYPSGIRAEGNLIIVSLAGDYRFSGTVSRGTLVVEVAKTEKVHLIFDGVSITSADSAAVWIKSADKVFLTLAAGSENTLTDGVYNSDIPGSPKGALYSEDDLTINGSGSLTVNGNSANAISVKNDLSIIGANITAYAAKNALKGNDSVRIKNATLLLQAEKDGIKSDTADKPAKGFVYICDSDIEIDAADDAIQAELYVRIPSGNIVCRADDLAINCDGEITVADGCLK